MSILQITKLPDYFNSMTGGLVYHANEKILQLIILAIVS